jgi:hypothetical protein
MTELRDLAAIRRAAANVSYLISHVHAKMRLNQLTWLLMASMTDFQAGLWIKLVFLIVQKL